MRSRRTISAQGYQKAKMTDTGMDTLKWGSDYLLRTLARQKKQNGERYPVYLIAYQVQNVLSFSLECSHCTIWKLTALYIKNSVRQ